MKKFLFSLFAMLTTMSVAYSQEQILPKDEVNQVKVENVYLSTISETDFPVFLYSGYKYGEENKDTHVSGVEFNIQLPDGVEFVTKQNGDPEYKIGTTFDNSPTVNLVNGVLKVIMGSSNPIKSAHGMLIAFKIKKSTEFNRPDDDVLKGGKIFNVIESKSGPYQLNDFNFDITITDRVVLDENSPFDITATGKTDVLVKRSFKAGNLSTICFPFKVSNGKLTGGALGENVKYAKFSSWKSEEAGKDICINFTSTNEGMESGTPYLIMVNSDINEFALDKVTFSDDNHPVTFNNTEISIYDEDEEEYIYAKGTMTGFSNLHAMGANELFLQDNTFYYSVAGQNIKGFRATFKFKDPNGKDYLIEKTGSGARTMLMIDGNPIEETTGINHYQLTAKTGKVYSVTGRYMGENVNMKSLPKGVYVVDGVKVINK